MPRVSVIIPTYNRKDYVQEAIDSVLAQTYTDYEIIVVDDGSTDGTGKVLQARYRDRIRYVWQENQGESVARNCGIEMSTGTYIGLLDSDDVWLPDKLSRQVDVFDHCSDSPMVCTDAWRVDANGTFLSSRSMRRGLSEDAFMPAALCLENPVINSSALMSRVAFIQAGGYDRRLHYGEDWDLWLRMAIVGKIRFIDQPLVLFRQHPGSQNQFPSQERATRMLEDRLPMLEKAFALASDHIPATIMRESQASQYAEAGFVNYGVGDGHTGKKLIERARAVYPEKWHSKQLLKDQLIHFAFLSIAATGYRSSEPGERCLDTAFANWPDGIRLSARERRQLRARLFAQMGFHLADTNTENETVSGQHFIRAVKYDPRLLRNRGILSHLASCLKLRASKLMLRMSAQR